MFGPALAFQCHSQASFGSVLSLSVAAIDVVAGHSSALQGAVLVPCEALLGVVPSSAVVVEQVVLCSPQGLVLLRQAVSYVLPMHRGASPPLVLSEGASAHVLAILGGSCVRAHVFLSGVSVRAHAFLSGASVRVLLDVSAPTHKAEPILL